MKTSVTFKCSNKKSSFYSILGLIVYVIYQTIFVLGEDSPPPVRTLILDQNINDNTLQVLNSYRKLHKVPPLEYDSILGEHAAKWALKLHHKAIKTGKLIPYYSHPHIEGENVMVSHQDMQNPINGQAAIDSWYSENKYYNWSANEFQFKTAQFTQMIWKNTKKIGIAIVYDPAENYTIIVARYKPPGNIGFVTSFKENVLPASKSEILSYKHLIIAGSSISVPVIRETSNTSIPKNNAQSPKSEVKSETPDKTLNTRENQPQPKIQTNPIKFQQEKAALPRINQQVSATTLKPSEKLETTSTLNPVVKELITNPTRSPIISVPTKTIQSTTPTNNPSVLEHTTIIPEIKSTQKTTKITTSAPRVTIAPEYQTSVSPVKSPSVQLSSTKLFPDFKIPSKAIKPEGEKNTSLLDYFPRLKIKPASKADAKVKSEILPGEKSSIRDVKNVASPEAKNIDKSINKIPNEKPSNNKSSDSIKQNLEKSKQITPSPSENKILKAKSNSEQSQNISKTTKRPNTFAGRKFKQNTNTDLDVKPETEERNVPHISSTVKVSDGNLTKFVSHSLDDSPFVVSYHEETKPITLKRPKFPYRIYSDHEN